MRRSGRCARAAITANSSPNTALGRSALASANVERRGGVAARADRKSTRLNSSHLVISYAVFCLKKKTPKATSSTLYFDSLTVNAGNGGFLHCIQMDTSVNAANQVVSVGADIAFDADPKFFACLVRFESSSVLFFYPSAYHRDLHSFPTRRSSD